MGTLRVLIIHPDTLIRDALRASMQAGSAGIDVVGCYGDSCEVICDRNRRRLRPQIVICQESQACLGPRCLSVEDIYPQAAVLRIGQRTLDLPVRLRADQEERILTALQAYVHIGSPPSLEEQTHTLQPVVRLTQREVRMVGFLRRGLSNKEIAVELHLNVQTVKNHLHHVFKKLNVRTRHQAIKSAAQ